ncbi:hypothetical protein FB451DRAFT_1202169 [Mycena latifolia]|nr:hypothetical protein FB451DRAFT_1202169 [Mycena latifolia]
MFDYAPVLREVLLEHIPPVIIPLPWQQLTRFTGELYADILNFLTLPNLETLEIREPDSDGEVLDLFLSRSSPPLRRLAIPGDEIDATPLVSVPGLIDLEIFSPPHRLLFHLFGLFRQDPSFLWQLRKLSLLRCQDARWREANHEGSLSDIVNTMATALAARRDTHEGCSQFSLRLESHFPSFSDEELRPLKKLKAEGMVIYVGTEVESIV